jgi:hypothetical protein
MAQTLRTRWVEALKGNEAGRVILSAVMPAKAGIHLFFRCRAIARRWIPAFAGMTPWL